MDNQPVPFSEVTPEVVASFLVNLEKALEYAKAVTVFTPTKIDDQVMDWALAFIAFIKPMSAEPWFLASLNFLLSFLYNHPAGRDILLKLNPKLVG